MRIPFCAREGKEIMITQELLSTHKDTRDTAIVMKLKNGETKTITIAEVSKLTLQLVLGHPNDRGLFLSMKNYEKAFWYLADHYTEHLEALFDNVCGPREGSEPSPVRFIYDPTLVVKFPKMVKK